jgi:hypothetical protein
MILFERLEATKINLRVQVCVMATVDTVQVSLMSGIQELKRIIRQVSTCGLLCTSSDIVAKYNLMSVDQESEFMSPEASANNSCLTGWRLQRSIGESNHESSSCGLMLCYVSFVAGITIIIQAYLVSILFQR